VKIRAGFTLIELIASILIIGIIAGIGSLAIPMYAKGYLFVRNNQAIGQKAQIALVRLGRELADLQSITATSTSPTSITYTRLSNSITSPTIMTQTLTYDSTNNRITLNSTGGPFNETNTLLDNVTAFTLSYYQTGTSAWALANPPTPSNLALLSTVAISITEASTGANDSSSTTTFNTTVSPRNNGNTGGVTPPTPSNPPPANGGHHYCFVATAAYGHEDHPTVVLLREFRDRFLEKCYIGRCFISAYYKVGPSLADLIRNRPWACFAVRVLLSPIAGTALLIMYFPASIPVIFIISWGGFYFMRHKFSKVFTTEAGRGPGIERQSKKRERA
jgi:prepilin-type N-terminal cleavage/methylation domain-containing protein